MTADVPLQCACGGVRGLVRGVSAKSGNRLVCYCDDCQSFAHFLAGADEILDAHGGTEIFQTSPARLEIAAGAQHLACVRLTGSGLLRWYADCCKTPIGNTLATRRLPFIGLIHSCLRPPSEGRSLEDVLGPVRARVQARFAKGDRAQLAAHARAPLSLILRFVGVIASAALRGDRSPLFDAETGAPCVTPRVLAPEELQRVEAARDAA